MKKILSFFAALLATAFFLGCLAWGIKYNLDLPLVKFSVSQQRVVAVEAKGKSLPLDPLPEKYETRYVQ